MNIGIDLDDVLADFRKGWLKYYNNRFNTNYKPSEVHSFDLTKVFNVSKDIIEKRIKDFYRTKIFEQLEPIRDSKTSIRKITKHHNLFVITSRPTWLEQKTTLWLESHFEDSFDKIILSNQFGNKNINTITTKGSICKINNITLIIEDSPGYSHEAALQGIDVLLFDKSWNRVGDFNRRVKRVKSWEEIKNYLIKDKHSQVL